MRRYQEEESNGHERWVISYADFITLLFAFFVVMYSISSVNEGKYKVLSKSLEDVFTDSKTNFKQHTVGMINPTGKNFSDKEIPKSHPGDYADQQEYQYSVDGNDVEIEGGGDADVSGGLEDITDTLKIQFEQLINADLISINSNDLWAEIQIRSSILFPSGRALPSRQAMVIIQQIADQLKTAPNPIHVEGFTDNVPIKNQYYPSNWELSASRAAAVVRLLSDGGVNPDRLAAVGYGEHQPIADNTTPSGRQKNRRVVMVISRDIGESQKSKIATEPQSAQVSTGSANTSQRSGTVRSGEAFLAIEEAIQKTKDEEITLARKKSFQQSIRRPSQ